MNSVYRQKVELLLRLLPLVMDEEVFAVHGGSAINLFVNEMPRYSVDIDLTYIPLDDREKSLKEISSHLETMASKAKRMFHGLHVIPNYGTSKLLCEYRGYQVKVEVNQTKRGIVGGELQHLPLCAKAQNEFGMPSVKWKSMNLAKLKTKNPDKLKAEAEKLERCLYLD